ncbi:hypothetical protein P9E76_15640 [Schinkia azotoformans]|uniref:Uncharacterized protein n=1 Tax=Schinkia azotoformans LMG 9581 TaxID=1131731 RepID=K6D6G3_SCHAZ|nr:hypothetical protein [Schinkia azotoformans]EKN68097.1 hypothetical protein BAZO_06274 [Schinkia azotoformans LMG 9581]MEC1638093.1 hypothetical protein [Schinkia azotoformans]MEC1946473.1 hypothetical protein [Schinkia azotoformans]
MKRSQTSISKLLRNIFLLAVILGITIATYSIYQYNQNLPKILGVADPYIDTNVDASTILAIGKGLIAGKSQPVETIRIPINDSYVNDRVKVGAVLKIDFNKNKQALTDFLAEDTESNLE